MILAEPVASECNFGASGISGSCRLSVGTSQCTSSSVVSLSQGAVGWSVDCLSWDSLESKTSLGSRDEGLWPRDEASEHRGYMISYICPKSSFFF